MLRRRAGACAARRCGRRARVLLRRQAARRPPGRRARSARARRRRAPRRHPLARALRIDKLRWPRWRRRCALHRDRAGASSRCWRCSTRARALRGAGRARSRPPTAAAGRSSSLSRGSAAARCRCSSCPGPVVACSRRLARRAAARRRPAGDRPDRGRPPPCSTPHAHRRGELAAAAGIARPPAVVLKAASASQSGLRGVRVGEVDRRATAACRARQPLDARPRGGVLAGAASRGDDVGRPASSPVALVEAPADHGVGDVGMAWPAACFELGGRDLEGVRPDDQILEAVDGCTDRRCASSCSGRGRPCGASSSVNTRGPRTHSSPSTSLTSVPAIGRLTEPGSVPAAPVRPADRRGGLGEAVALSDASPAGTGPPPPNGGAAPSGARRRRRSAQRG